MPGARKTRYASASGVEIAYQVVGDGPIDLLLYTGAGVPIDCMDDEPSMARSTAKVAPLSVPRRSETELPHWGSRCASDCTPARSSVEETTSREWRCTSERELPHSQAEESPCVRGHSPAFGRFGSQVRGSGRA